MGWNNQSSSGRYNSNSRQENIIGALTKKDIQVLSKTCRVCQYSERSGTITTHKHTTNYNDLSKSMELGAVFGMANEIWKNSLHWRNYI